MSNFPIPENATRDDIEKATLIWRSLREERLAQEKIAAKIKEQEDETKQFLIASMLGQKMEGVLIDGRQTGVKTTEISIVIDKHAFSEYVLDSRSLELLQFRISESAIKELEDEGEVVPGIGKLDKFDLFDRKS